MTRVLILDDDPLWCEVLAGALRGAGCEAAATDLPRTALQNAATFDLLVIDLALPGTDGLTMLEQLKRVAPHVPAIVVTCYPYAPIVDEAEALGAARTFEKNSLADVVDFVRAVPAP